MSPLGGLIAVLGPLLVVSVLAAAGVWAAVLIEGGRLQAKIRRLRRDVAELEHLCAAVKERADRAERAAVMFERRALRAEERLMIGTPRRPL
jgi:hypothetical protein